ncbi:hypothetical protein [Corynebacterium aquatimens]|uniref:Antitoxin VbhA domain-containing protein n=1 Tax=Corynebacterium aquatimens TaxID=1190508 RepID=A0A931E115_9CORY|nr:hypothetical protein [Corynebacterium aquatimens]MBG6121897.1 hypothetical protein [Corynebacterium aquatimens]WJY65565.1 hypothetical protein CAQUA_04260 [Corynebacterium aquatimens]
MTQTIASAADVAGILRNSDGILAAAGHTAEDDCVTEIRRLAAAGDISSAEAVTRIKKLFEKP